MRPTPTVAKPGQESVWEYPRPPRLEPSNKRIEVLFRGHVIAETHNSIRVLETSLAPSYYIPPDDIHLEFLTQADRTTWCEWKGKAQYFSIEAENNTAANAAWAYFSPTSPYESIRGYFSFYPSRAECSLDGEVVKSQPGGFYGGWVTSDIIGPFKGERGTENW
jgi:uncharacterized protein (DUF427 family)